MKKQQILELKSIRTAAKELGVPFGTLAYWIRHDTTIHTYSIGNVKAIEVAEVQRKLAHKLAMRKQGVVA